MGFRDVFPDNASLAVCLAYMGCFVLQGILTRASQVNGSYHYNTTTVVMCSELLKLAVSASVYISRYACCRLYARVCVRAHLYT